MRDKETVMGKSVSTRSFEELRLEESNISKNVEGEILLVQGIDRRRATLKTVCIPSAQETRNCVKNCAIISAFQKRSYVVQLAI